MFNWIKNLFGNAFKNDISNQVIESFAAQAMSNSGVDVTPASVNKEELEKMTKAKIVEEASKHGITLSKTLTKNQMIEEFIKTIKEK